MEPSALPTNTISDCLRDRPAPKGTLLDVARSRGAKSFGVILPDEGFLREASQNTEAHITASDGRINWVPGWSFDFRNKQAPLSSSVLGSAPYLPGDRGERECVALRLRCAVEAGVTRRVAAGSPLEQRNRAPLRSASSRLSRSSALPHRWNGREHSPLAADSRERMVVALRTRDLNRYATVTEPLLSGQTVYFRIEPAL